MTTKRYITTVREVLSWPIGKTKPEPLIGEGSEVIVEDFQAWDSSKKVFCIEEIPFQLLVAGLEMVWVEN